MSHQAVVPPVGPSLAESSLGTSEKDFDGGILLGRVELGRIEDPGEHVLAVDGLDHRHLGLVGSELGKKVSVLVTDLDDPVLSGWAVTGKNRYHLRREIHAGVS